MSIGLQQEQRFLSLQRTKVSMFIILMIDSKSCVSRYTMYSNDLMIFGFRCRCVVHTGCFHQSCAGRTIRSHAHWGNKSEELGKRKRNQCARRRISAWITSFVKGIGNISPFCMLAVPTSFMLVLTQVHNLRAYNNSEGQPIIDTISCIVTGCRAWSTDSRD